MRRKHARIVIASSALGALLVISPIAGADPPSKQQCVSANSNAQTLQRAGKLRAAREQLLVCAVQACPEAVRDDCTQRATDVDAAMPTIVFEVKDAAGNDVAEVKVTLDGATLAERLDGSAIAIDPGEHKLAFESKGAPVVEKTLLVRTAEKNRHERILLGAATANPTSTPSTDSGASGGSRGSEESGEGGGGGRKTLGLVLGGVGIVGIGIGTLFALKASASWSNSKSECATATNCPNYDQAVTDHDSASSSALVSTIAFAAGGAVLAAGAVLFFTAPSSPSARANATALRVAPLVGAGSAGLVAKVGF
jgi:hypothetical protein